MPGIDTLIPRFKAADRTTRLETLLDYSRKLPPLPERLESEKSKGDHRVHECQTPVAIYPEVVDGKMYFHADVPQSAPTIRALLVQHSLEGERQAIKRLTAPVQPEELKDRFVMIGRFLTREPLR